MGGVRTIEENVVSRSKRDASLIGTQVGRFSPTPRIVMVTLVEKSFDLIRLNECVPCNRS